MNLGVLDTANAFSGGLVTVGANLFDDRVDLSDRSGFDVKKSASKLAKRKKMVKPCAPLPDRMSTLVANLYTAKPATPLHDGFMAVQVNADGRR
ncbi:hypothetical protein BWQ96_08245 [Gracilariopsis chorda]|uniref:Uncharacterized protein n=1 Tax=Gracilariopsis chorda TaxID=448386 RepID=A0A2V3IIX9_9FLOR|nr:hypothetical protein BWQ96_08245 [Gracilariopsis chorda]|eukprot:PXF42037.1 hypothetical protein BWQ96_08245 [Gracilariopsis chorda]